MMDIITYAKVSKLENEINRRDPQSEYTDSPVLDLIKGKFLNEDGSYATTASWFCCDFVDVSDAKDHKITINSVIYGNYASTVFYDAEKNVVGYINGKNASDYGITPTANDQTYTVTLSDTVKYVRFNGCTDYMAYDELYVFYTSERLKSDVTDDIVGVPQYMNLVDQNRYTKKTYINGANGKQAASNYYDSTDFILLEPNTKYYVGGLYLHATNKLYAFYSEPNESSFISSPYVTVTIDTVSHGTIETGNHPMYIRMSDDINQSAKPYISKYVDCYTEYTSKPFSVEQIAKAKCRHKKILVIGDSISTDSYGNYKKWVTDLIDDGYFPPNVNNNSQHATGFVKRYDNQPNDFISRIKAVTNPETYDLVIVFGGINDANALIPVGTDEDTDYTTYFKPALKEFYRYMCLNFVNARIGVLLPLPCSTQNRDPSVIGVQYTYSNLQKEVAEAYSLPILDLTNKSGFYVDANREGVVYDVAQAFRNRWTLVVGQYDPDGAHPTEEYEKRFLAPMIKAFIESM